MSKLVIFNGTYKVRGVPISAKNVIRIDEDKDLDKLIEEQEEDGYTFDSIVDYQSIEHSKYDPKREI